MGKTRVLKIYKRRFTDYSSCSSHSFNVSNYELGEERGRATYDFGISTLQWRVTQAPMKANSFLRLIYQVLLLHYLTRSPPFPYLILHNSPWNKTVFMKEVQISDSLLQLSQTSKQENLSASPLPQHINTDLQVQSLLLSLGVGFKGKEVTKGQPTEWVGGKISCHCLGGR